MKLSTITLAAGAFMASTAMAVAADCESITLGSAISLTGKYATNGVHAKNGYEFAIKKISEAGGVKFGGKCYNFNVIYYDDESKGDRGATLAEQPGQGSIHARAIFVRSDQGDCSGYRKIRYSNG